MLDPSASIAAIMSFMLVIPDLLAATDEPGFFANLISNIWLWGRVALGIGLVIFVHELGHFVAAKSFGVKCEKFYVGFDVPIKIGPIKFPRTLGKFTYGETEYGIGIVPLGGYVKMLGQDDDPRKMQEEAERIREEGGDPDEVEPKLDPRSFPAKPVWQRMIIISAGVVVNVITGILFAAIAFGFGVQQIPAVVGGVTPGGAAWKAGIEPGGKVVAVNEFRDEKMPFREMVIEIIKQSIASPDEAIAVTIEYEDGEKTFDLVPDQVPAGKRMRPMIGIGMPDSVRLSKHGYALHGSVAEDVLTELDARATVVEYDGNPIIDSNNGAENRYDAKFFDYLYTHPNKPIDLKLVRADGSQHSVTLPPQPMQTLGLQFQPGAIEALVKDGPAEKAGMKIGDRILSVDGNSVGGALQLATGLSELSGSHTFKVQRGDAEVEITISSGDMLQTIPPTYPVSKLIAINRFGFAFPISPIVSSVDSGVVSSLDDQGMIQAGDQVKTIRLLTSTDELPDHLKEPGAIDTINWMQEGWEISDTRTLVMLMVNLQAFPKDVKFEVLAERPESKVIVGGSTTVQQNEELYTFVRGLNFPAREITRKSESVSEAVSLGWSEGKRRFGEVFGFLGMIAKGQVGLKDVGGPVAIASIAKDETEKGVSKQLMFLTMLSMNLAILNFLPIPALDGGHMVFLTYELIRGKRANEELEFRLTIAGVLSLLALMAVVFANDILRVFNG